MKIIFLVIFFFSCGHVNEIDQVERNKVVRDKFRPIDEKLNSFAEKLNAKILTEGSGHSINGIAVPSEYTEDRRITWTDSLFSKAIIIQPNFGFDTANFNTPKWNFINLVWLEEGSLGLEGKPFWQHYHLREVEFEVISKNIDQLLISSMETLKKIKREDLKSEWSNISDLSED